MAVSKLQKAGLIQPFVIKMIFVKYPNETDLRDTKQQNISQKKSFFVTANNFENISCIIDNLVL